MSFRKELKIKVTRHQLNKSRGIMCSRGMKKIYKNRQIFSQYFDTPFFQMFWDSEEGVVPRKKIRIRWYNITGDDLFIEKKISSPEGRYKTSEKISIFSKESRMKIGIIDSYYGRLMPKTLISYTREYYSIGDLRITYDSNLKYFFNKSKIIKSDPNCVIELKAPFSLSFDEIEKVFPEAGFSRFSKYSEAIKYYKNLF